MADAPLAVQLAATVAVAAAMVWGFKRSVIDLDTGWPGLIGFFAWFIGAFPLAMIWAWPPAT